MRVTVNKLNAQWSGSAANESDPQQSPGVAAACLREADVLSWVDCLAGVTHLRVVGYQGCR